MWDLVDRTPFVADRCFAREADGSEVFLVAVKATFTIGADGSLRVAPAQLPIRRAPVYRGDPLASSLLEDVDFALGKPAADVLVHGHVYAPHRSPAREIVAELRVGPHARAIVAVGERRWEKGLSGFKASEPTAVEKVPLAWEWAFGGRGVDDAGRDVEEPRNPVGRGLVAGTRPVAGALLPQLEDPEQRMTHWRQRPRPAGFGPLAPHWSPRRELAGTMDEAWRRFRAPLPPLDADPRHRQSAPQGQQLELVGGEPVELKHLTPGGQLRFSLPRIALRLRSRIGGARVEHRPAIHTVVVEPDAGRLVLVWQSALPCHSTLYTLRSTVVEVEAADVSLPPRREREVGGDA